MDMKEYILDLPNQLKAAVKLASEFFLPEDYRDVKNVVFLGMGGSAIGGDLTRAYLAEYAKVPIEVARDFNLPACVDSSTLVIAVSYSGNTEEVLAAYSTAKEKGAKLIALTKGGKLAEMAKADGIPLFQFEYDSQPRAALGYLFAPLVVILEKLGLAVSISGIDTIEIKFDEKQAQDLAKKLQGKIPFICASNFLIPVARRFKNQLNENSKQMAVVEEIPEMFHNVVQGLDFPKMDSRLRGNDNPLTFVLFESNFYHERNSLRINILKDIFKDKKISFENIVIEGESKLQQLLNAIMLADLTSYFLAELNEVDPTPVPTIDFMKKQLM